VKADDALHVTDACSVVVIRAALLTLAHPVAAREPEDLPPLPVVEELDAEPCVLCQPKGS